MVKEADMQLSCRQCGKGFILTKAEQEFYELKGFNLPTHCKECRASKQVRVQSQACSQCGTELDKRASVYCANCLQTAHFVLEKENKQIKMAFSAARSKLGASESQKAEFAELLRQKEQELAQRTGQQVHIDPMTDPEFVAALRKAYGQLEERYSAVLDQAKKNLSNFLEE